MQIFWLVFTSDCAVEERELTSKYVIYSEEHERAQADGKSCDYLKKELPTITTIYCNITHKTLELNTQ